MLILDTDVLSALRRPERHPELRHWLLTQEEDQLFLSAITIGEISRGIALAARRDPAFARDLSRWLDQTMTLFADRILPFGATEARLWGTLCARIGHAGADLQIAATALGRGARVVTGNERHFEPAGVELINPFKQ